MSTSIGSPASASSSTMEPCASCRMYLIGTLVRPSSTVSCTGMSSTIWMSCIGLPWAATGWAWLSKAGALSAAPEGALACSSRAWAQSSAMLSWVMVSVVSVDIGISQPGQIGSAQIALDTQGVLAFVCAVLAFEERHTVHMGPDRREAVEFEEVAHLHRQQLLHRGIGLSQFGHHGHLGRLDLVAQQLDPAAVDFDRVALHAGVQDIADRFQRGVGNADVQRARDVTDLQREAGGDHDLARGGDGGELGLHFRALVRQLQRVHAAPGLLVFLGHHLDQPVDHALLGGREVAPFDAGVELAVAAKQAVDHAEQQGRLAEDQSVAAQRAHRHDVEVGGHHQLTQEGAGFLPLHRTDRDLRAAADEVEQAQPQVAREAFVDDLHGGHAPPHDALLAGEVVAAHPVGGGSVLLQLLALAGDAFQQGVDFFLGQKRVGHGGLPVYWTMKLENSTPCTGFAAALLRFFLPAAPSAPGWAVS